jgi:hypothetical protein
MTFTLPKFSIQQVVGRADRRRLLLLLGSRSTEAARAFPAREQTSWNGLSTIGATSNERSGPIVFWTDARRRRLQQQHPPRRFTAGRPRGFRNRRGRADSILERSTGSAS